MGVLNGVTGADKADGVRDPFIELDVRLVGECKTGECLGKRGAGLGVVLGEKLLRHPRSADDEVYSYRVEDIEHCRDAVHERDVNGLDHRQYRR